jgi:hypothetical protein
MIRCVISQYDKINSEFSEFERCWCGPRPAFAEGDLRAALLDHELVYFKKNA